MRGMLGWECNCTDEIVKLVFLCSHTVCQKARIFKDDISYPTLVFDLCHGGTERLVILESHKNY
jgi:hypothetical protein